MIKEEDLLLMLSFYGWKRTTMRWEKGKRAMVICASPYFVYHIDRDDFEGYWGKFPYRDCELEDGKILVHVSNTETWTIDLRDEEIKE